MVVIEDAAPGIADDPSGAGARPDLPGVDRRLSRVERRLSEVAHALERLVPAVDTVRGLVVDELAQLQGDVRRTAALVDSFSASLNADTAALGAQLDEVRQGVVAPAMTSELEHHLEEIADRHAATIQRMSAAAAEDRAEAARALQQVLRDELASIAAPLLERGEAPARAAEATDDESAREAQRALVRDTMEQLRGTLDSAIAAQAARVEAVVGTIREQVATETELSRHDTVEAIARLESGVGERVEALRSVSDEVRRAVEAAAQRIVGEVDRAHALSGEGAEDVADRMAEVGSLIEARLSAFALQSDDAIDQLRAAVSANRLPTESLSAAVDSLQAEVEQGRRQAERDRQTVAELTASVEALTAAQRDQVDRLAAMLAEQRASMREESAADRRAFVAVSNESAALVADTMQERLREGEARIDRAMAAITRMEANVVDHLERRELQAQDERVALVELLVEQLLDGISRRDRRKLGRQLEERAAATPARRPARPATSTTAPAPRRTPDPAPTPVAPTPAASTPAPAATPERRAEPPVEVEAAEEVAESVEEADVQAAEVVDVEAAQEVEEVEEVAASAEDGPADDEPSPFAPQPRWGDASAAAPPIVRKSRAAHPPAPVPAPAPPGTGADTEATPVIPPTRARGPKARMSPKVSARRALTDREVLGRVKGLGTTRQSMLLDTFGSLDGIRDASDEDLLACRGIGPALVEQLREVLGESAP